MTRITRSADTCTRARRGGMADPFLLVAHPASNKPELRSKPRRESIFGNYNCAAVH
jgi:hypothetical protein